MLNNVIGHLSKRDHYLSMIIRLLIVMVILSESSFVAAQVKEDKRRTGSQIVDDTTKNIYGPKTTRWTTEKNLFYGKNTYYALDTSVNNYHRWTYVQHFNNFYKDLGNVGTALGPVFPILSSAVGATSGFRAYDPYFETEEPKYFDTKSPYTRMFLVWGGKGRAMTKVEFSRNINPRWNFGFNYRPILADRQLQRQKGVRQTTSHYYDLYTTYKSKNEKYLLLANYRRIRHKVNESGGVAVVAGDPFIKLFDINARQVLAKAKSEDFRNNLHLFHQYKLAGPFQLYHITDRGQQVNKFDDLTGSEPKDFYDSTTTQSDTVSDRTALKVFQNEIGIKGKAAFLFYSFYYKHRQYNYLNAKLDAVDLFFSPKSTEHYVGGRISLEIDSLTELSGNAEYLLDGNYRIEGDLKSPWLDASFRSLLSKPALMQTAYFGGYDFWNNSFSDVFTNQVNGFLKAQIGPLFVSPGVTLSNFKNYIFLREALPVAPGRQMVLPFQSPGNQTIFSPELRLSFQFLRHFHLRPQVIYTKFLRNDDEAFRIPEVFANVQLAYENRIFKKNLQVQIGVDLHWKSSYKALGYDVATQQFYNQDNTIAPSFLLADIFFTGKMKRGRFFLTYHNLMQAFTKSGYISAPGYAGQRSILDFGFDLLLFD